MSLRISQALSNIQQDDSAKCCSTTTTTCMICSLYTVSTCSHCGEAVCADDLATHRTCTNKCQPWRVATLPVVGRVLIATREIRPWEAVLVDTALVTAPDDSPVCVGCLGEVSGTVVCVRCKWPVCKEKCQDEEAHQEECQIFQRNNIVPLIEHFRHNHWLYTALAVLRVLLVKIKNTEGWKNVEHLMDHWDEREKDNQVAEAVKRMCFFFQKKCQLEWVTLQDVQHSFGVLKTNSVSLICQEGRALYPLVSILSHSCSSNLEPVSNPSKTITLRAKVPIHAGEQLSMRYTHFMHSKWDIQARLAREWLFVCTCIRCQDVAELGSYFSALKCSCGGYYSTKLRNNQLNVFVCSQCGKCKEFKEKLLRFEEIEKDLNSINVGSNVIQESCNQIEGDEEVHDNHYMKTKLYMKYVDIFHHTEDQDILEDVVQRVKIVMNTLQLIDRGCSKLMGKYLMVLVECQQKVLMTKKRTGNISLHDLQQAIKELARVKLTAMRMLSQYVLL